MGPTVFGRCARQRTHAPRSGALWQRLWTDLRAFTPHFPAPLSGNSMFEGGILHNFLRTSQWHHPPSTPHKPITFHHLPPNFKRFGSIMLSVT